MYGCESWTIKKAEQWRIDAFELWCWKRLLTVPWTSRRSNQPILKEISPGYSLEGLINSKLLQYSCLETPMNCMKRQKDVKDELKDELPREVGAQYADWRQQEKGMTEDKMAWWHHWLDGHEFEQTLEAGDGQESLACCSSWGHKESDMTEWLNWTDWYVYKSFSTILVKGFRKNIQKKKKKKNKNKTGREGEIGEHKLNEIGALNMK